MASTYQKTKESRGMIPVDNCPLCGSRACALIFENFDRLHFLPGEFNVALCSDCRSLYLKNIPEDLNKYYPEGDYYSTYESNPYELKLKKKIVSLYYSGRDKRGLSYLLLYPLKNRVQGIPDFVRNGRVLDVGCGFGLLLDILKWISWETYGLDVSKNAIKLLKKKGHHGICGEFKADLYPSNYFDAILMNHSIEHVRNLRDYIRLIYIKLKPGGQFILVAPNASSLGYKIFGKSWAPIETPRHLFVPAPGIMQRVLEGEGFKVQSIKYTGCNWAQSLNYKVNGKYTRASFFYKKYIVAGLEGIAQLLNLFRLGDSFQINARK